MERPGYYPDVFERLDQGSRVRSAQVETAKVNLKQNDTEFKRRNSFENAGNIAVFSLLLVLLAASCSRSEASVSAYKDKNLPTATITSEIGEPEVIRRDSPPARLTDENAIILPEDLQLPEGIRVVVGRCASDGRCYDYNFYWAPTHEAVLQEGEREHKALHEICHAHQHSSINGGEPLHPSQYGLELWYQTEEGQSFAKAVEGLPWPWSDSASNDLEDFAWTCAFYYFDPHYLQDISPERYQWVAENLP